MVRFAPHSLLESRELLSLSVIIFLQRSRSPLLSLSVALSRLSLSPLFISSPSSMGSLMPWSGR